MSTEKSFIINSGYYDEEANDTKDVLIRYTDDDLLDLEPPLGACSVTDILELADWISGSDDQA